MDFKEITSGAEPEALLPSEIEFESGKLSEAGTGTRIELQGVKKRVAMSYRFIVNKLIRTFDVNDEDFTIHIRKHDDEYKALQRSNLDFLSIMDTIVVIGDEHADKLDAVKTNGIPSEYKSCTTFDEYLKKQNPRQKTS